MQVDLSIRQAPDILMRRLRARAERHNRSIEDEAVAILESALQERPVETPSQVLAQVRRLGLKTPSESADLIRADRDAR